MYVSLSLAKLHNLYISSLPFGLYLSAHFLSQIIYNSIPVNNPRNSDIDYLVMQLFSFQCSNPLMYTYSCLNILLSSSSFSNYTYLSHPYHFQQKSIFNHLSVPDVILPKFPCILQNLAGLQSLLIC